MYLDGSFTEDRRAWEKELQRHFAEIHIDPEQTKEEQEKRITMCKQDGGRHFTEQRRVAEITIDLFYRQGQDVRKQSQRARRFHRERDDQTVATGANQ